MGDNYKIKTVARVKCERLVFVLEFNFSMIFACLFRLPRWCNRVVRLGSSGVQSVIKLLELCVGGES